MRPSQTLLAGVPGRWHWRAIQRRIPVSRQPIGPIGHRLLVRAAIAGAIILLLFAATLVIFRSVYADRIYPAVSIADMNVGGMTRADARQTLAQRAATLERGTILLSFNGKTWSPTLSDIGITVNIDKSLDAALAVGRSGNGWTRLSDTAGLMRQNAAVPLAVTWNQNVFTSWLDRVDRDLGLPPHDAYLAIDGTKVTIVPEVNGTIVNRNEATRLIGSAISSLRPISAQLPVQNRIAKVRAGDLAQMQQAAGQALAKPITLTYAGKSWTLQPSAMGKFLHVETDATNPGTAVVRLDIDEQKLASWLNDQFAGNVNSNPVDAKVAWSDDQQALVATEASQNGARIAPLTLASAVGQSLLGDHRAVEIPMTVIKPRIGSHNLAALGITTKLGVGSSNFEGSDNGRATNIQVGAGLLNGTLIPPHSDFSFNHAVGAITADKGYVISQVIDGQNIGTDIGGGICQVSTTVYRAAFEAGMPITEWYPHTFRLGFYEQDDWTPGIDASILQLDGDPDNPNSGDFKFQNPSDHWMLVEAYVDGPRVYVIIYGPNLGYKVDIVGPSDGPVTNHGAARVQVDDSLSSGTVNQVQAALDGYEFTYTRTVSDARGNVIEQRDFTTDFASRPAIYKVSPDMRDWKPAGDSD